MVLQSPGWGCYWKLSEYAGERLAGNGMRSQWLTLHGRKNDGPRSGRERPIRTKPRLCLGVHINVGVLLIEALDALAIRPPGGARRSGSIKPPGLERQQSSAPAPAVGWYHQVVRVETRPMAARASISPPNSWPELPLAAWQDTYATLHLWTQIVGKVRLALTPRINHWWEVPLYVNARGLTTSAIPYREEIFEIQFDFIDHRLLIQTSWGSSKTLPLKAQSVASFYAAFMSALRCLGIDLKIWTMPCEVPHPIPFEADSQHAAYDREYVSRFWRILILCANIFREFRARFIGKDSPVHFFWGSFDLCVTRFSGRRAPERVGADAVTREAYSHEVISAGFWPGAGYKGPAFYAYAAPEPAGFAEQKIKPAQAFYDPQLKEFLLLYDDVRTAASPHSALLSFLESTYDAGANLAGWDRKELERA